MKKLEYWITHSLDKVFPDTPKPKEAETAVRIIAAGNEAEDAQIVLRPRKNLKLTSVEFSSTSLSCSAGELPSDCVELHWIWYTWVHANPINSKSPENWIRKAPGFFPDAFLETREITVAPDWTQPLWVKVSVPGGTPAGEYCGEIILKCEYSLPALLGEYKKPKTGSYELRIPLRCRVWPFSLPENGTLHHTEWFFPDHLADYYHLEPWSEAHWEWISRAAEDMAAHHQDMILTSFFDLVDVVVTDPSKALDSLSFDFSRLDRWIVLFRRAGVCWIEGAHLAEREGGWFSPFVFKRLKAFSDEGEELALFNSNRMEEEEYRKYLERFLRAVYAHMETEFGLKNLVQHIADEPVSQNSKSWKSLAELVRSWLPKGIPIIDAAMSEKLGAHIDMRVPQIQEVKASRRSDKNVLEKGLWSYVCLAPQGNHPNRFLDQASVRNRILRWLSFSLRLEGFLHWGYNFWGSWCSLPGEAQNSPWTDATGGSLYAYKRQPLPAGDPFIVYPGRKGLCSSIRWEVLRKGFEDHKLLTLLEQLIDAGPEIPLWSEKGRDLLEDIRIRAARDSLCYCRDGEELLELRRRAGEIVSALVLQAYR